MKKLFFLLPILFVTIFFSLAYFLLAEKKTIAIEIDKIYVLNLDRSKDRLEKMEQELAKHNLPVKFTRFPAIDGNDIELVDRATGESIKGLEFDTNTKLLKGEFDIICSKDWPGGFQPIKLNRTKLYPRAKGEIACACSHRKIWQDILNNGYKNALVLEDDVVFAPNFDQYLAKALQYVPFDYDLLYLGIIDFPDSYDRFKHFKFINKLLKAFAVNPNPYFKQTHRNVASTWGYLVSNNGAHKLLENTTKHRYIDIVMRDAITKKKITAYAITPIQITTNDSPSLIGEHRQRDKFDNLEQEEFQ